MPLYDFKCKACGHEYEDIKSMSSKGPYKCPKCGAKRSARVFNMSGISMRTDRGSPDDARHDRGRIRR